MRLPALVPLILLATATMAWAGPPYVTDDPVPTDLHHFEIYAFGQGTSTSLGSGNSAGIDFNYGGFTDTQLTAVLPMEFDTTRGGPSDRGFGNIELAVKYRFLHQETFGFDVAVFPRIFLPSLSQHVGTNHASLLLPIWIGKDFGPWSTFGGGACALNRSHDSRNYCLAGWAVTRKVLPDLTLGAEIYHQSADTAGGKALTGIGGGITYDLTDHYHLMASYGPGIENANAVDRYTWYAALLFTF